MAAIRNMITTASVILVLSVLIRSAFGIKCYQCNSFVHKDCEVIIPTNATDSPYLRECESPWPGDKNMFCRKIIQNIVALEVEQKRVIRKCSYELSERDCYHFEDEDHNELVCQCFTDACNQAGRGVSPVSVWRTLVPLGVVLASSTVVAVF